MTLGFFTALETQRFNATVPPAPEPEAEEESSSWMWILGVLLLAVGL